MCLKWSWLGVSLLSLMLSGPAASPPPVQKLVSSSKSRNVCTMPVLTCSFPPQSASSSSLETWWNVNVNHVEERETSCVLELFLMKGHAHRKKIKDGKTWGSTACCFHFSFLMFSSLVVAVNETEVMVCCLWGLVAASGCSNKQHGGIWEGSHSPGCWRKIL